MGAGRSTGFADTTERLFRHRTGLADLVDRRFQRVARAKHRRHHRCLVELPRVGKAIEHAAQRGLEFGEGREVRLAPASEILCNGFLSATLGIARNRCQATLNTLLNNCQRRLGVRLGERVEIHLHRTRTPGIKVWQNLRRRVRLQPARQRVTNPAHDLHHHFDGVGQAIGEHVADVVAPLVRLLRDSTQVRQRVHDDGSKLLECVNRDRQRNGTQPIHHLADAIAKHFTKPTNARDGVGILQHCNNIADHRLDDFEGLGKELAQRGVFQVTD